MNLSTMASWLRPARRRSKDFRHPRPAGPTKRQLFVEALEEREVPAALPFDLTIPDHQLPQGESVYAFLYAQLLENYTTKNNQQTIPKDTWVYFDTSVNDYRETPGTGVPIFASTSTSLSNSYILPDVQVQAAHIVFTIQPSGLSPSPTLPVNGGTTGGSVAQPVPKNFPDTTYDFVEFTWQKVPNASASETLTINTSTIDQFGLPIQLQIYHDAAGTVPANPSTPYGVGIIPSRAEVFTNYANFLQNQGEAGKAFLTTLEGRYGVSSPNRILSPEDVMAVQTVQAVTTSLAAGGSLAADAAYYYAITAYKSDDSVKTMLKTPMSATQTTMTVESNAGFPTASSTKPFFVKVENEYMEVVDNSTTTWTVIRNAYNSANEPHAASKDVVLVRETKVGNEVSRMDTTAGNQTIKLTWTADSQADGYNIYRAEFTRNGSNWNPGQWTLLTWPIANFTDDGNLPGTSISASDVPFHPLNSVFDEQINTLFTNYGTGKPSLVLQTSAAYTPPGSSTANNYFYTLSGNVVQLPDNNFAFEMIVSDVQDAAGKTVPAAEQPISVGTAFYIYQPYFNTNTYDPSKPAPPTGVNNVNLTASGMVFNASGVFADSATQPIPAPPSGGQVDPTSARVVLGALENQIVAAITRGIANSSLSPYNWANSPSQASPTVAPATQGGGFGTSGKAAADITYYYVVTAQNFGGAASGTLTETTPSLLFSAKPSTGDAVTVNWLAENPLKAQYFRIYRSTSPGGPYEYVGTSQSNAQGQIPNSNPPEFYPPVTSFVDDGIPAQQTTPYFYYPDGVASDLYAAFFHKPDVSIQGLSYASPYDDQGGFSSTLANSLDLDHFVVTLGALNSSNTLTANIQGPGSGTVGTPAVFTGSYAGASPSDIAGTTLQVKDLAGNVLQTVNNQPTLSFTAAQPGTYTVNYTVTPKVGAAVSATPKTFVVSANPNPPGPDRNETYVEALYLDILKRPADAPGLAGWTALLNGGETRAEIAFGILKSPEHQRIMVTDLYQKVLGRAPDSDGMNSCLNLFAKGLQYEQIKAILYASDEFFQKAGSTNAGYLSALYQTELGRPIDAAAQSQMLAKLQAGSTRYDCAYWVIYSPEDAARIITEDYQDVLGRAPDAAGLSGWTSLYLSGQRSNEILANIYGSDEFYNKLP